MRERKPFFSIKRFPLPHTPTPSKRTTRDFASLWTLGVKNLFWGFGLGCSRDWNRCQEWLCEHSVGGLRVLGR